MKIILFNTARNLVLNVELPCMPQIGHKINIHSFLTVKNASHLVEATWKEMQEKAWVVADIEWKPVNGQITAECLPHLEFLEAGLNIKGNPSNVDVLSNMAVNLETESVKYKIDDPQSENKLLEAARFIRMAVHQLS